MILSKSVIQEEIKKGNIVIEPFSDMQIGPGSIDLTLSDEFRIYTCEGKKVVLSNSFEFKDVTRVVRAKSYTLKPGELVLGITREKVTLPKDICGWVQGRSRFGRIGLSVHITASFVHPGVSNRTVLELFNAGPADLELMAGTRICQLILDRMEGKAQYKGRFKNQLKL